MERIQDFAGLQFPFTIDPIGRKAYDANNVEYATSTHQIDHDMFPGLIAFPRNDGDIQQAVKYAKQNGFPVSVMSGGHQYSGACSTHGKGIQLNLKMTYKSPQDLVVLPALPAPDDKRPLVYASVSQSLGEFNAFLKSHQLFVPHGQCTDVRLGGHAQTGGYGQLGRSFGLFGDHIWAIRLINHDGEIQEVTKANNPELFFAITGGSPGNFGVITHYTIEVHRDVDHDFPKTGVRPRGYKAIWLYNEKVLKLLLSEIAAMADDSEVARNFDLCVSVLSSSFPMFKLMPELKDNLDEILKNIADALGVNGDTKWPASVVLYAQWVPMNAEDKFSDKVDAWFQRFRDLNKFLPYWCIHAAELEEPMSEMTGEWLFARPREFDHPYDKRTYLTNSTTLAQDKWVDKVADQINQVLFPSITHFDLWENCYLSVQIQCYGGKYSQYYANRNNGTAYSWRDSTVVQILDCFYKEGVKGKALAGKWQAANDKLMVGENSSYSKQDRRVLWASYGDWDMDNTWPFYFESRDKYERIGRQRGLADPNGTFTPNPFCVKAAKS
ncbi:hypothetical protein H2200_002172 [Cladophialophora chaetospira]|uniref:FAD-binding PCMH-type domain-containing protein n=1 Tax=Cladophialophora chaetospira TaxID=386627 RepID=A0AA38XJA0_9EURO|nr:hypothetical protein H2200_002172 [Cladophialophora chaetospira]